MNYKLDIIISYSSPTDNRNRIIDLSCVYKSHFIVYIHVISDNKKLNGLIMS